MIVTEDNLDLKVKVLSYDTYNQVPHDDRLIGTITTTIGEASMRTS